MTGCTITTDSFSDLATKTIGWYEFQEEHHGNDLQYTADGRNVYRESVMFSRIQINTKLGSRLQTFEMYLMNA